MRFLLATYHDPANYPPTINSARTLAGFGHRVWLVGFYRGMHRDFRSSPNVTVRMLNSAPGSYPGRATQKVRDLITHRRSLEELCRTEQIEALIVYDDHSLWAARPLLRRVRTVYHVHDMATPGRERMLGRLDYLLHHRARSSLGSLAAVVMPEAGRLELAQTAWKLTVPTLVVPNAARLTVLERHDALVRLVEGRSGVRPEAVVVMAGGGGAVHMLDESIASLRHLPPSCHLVLIGCGSDSVTARLRELAERIGVGDRTHFVPYIAYDDLRVLLPSATVGLALYRRGGVDANKLHPSTASVKLMEYLAAGLPIVVNDTAGFRALAARTGGMVLAASETAEGIAAAIGEAVARREELGAQAYRAHRDEWNYEKLLAPLVQLLSDRA